MFDTKTTSAKNRIGNWHSFVDGSLSLPLMMKSGKKTLNKQPEMMNESLTRVSNASVNPNPK